jgi:plastocyanin
MQIGAAAAALVSAGALAIPAVAGITSVSVKDNVFATKSLTIRKGGSVKWIWRGHAPHNVTVSRGPVKFHSPNKVSGSFTKSFSRAGTYTIICTIHQGMQMTVKVK